MAHANQEPGTPQVVHSGATPSRPGVVLPVRTRGRNIVRRIARGALALLFVVGAATSLLPWGRAAVRGVLLLPPLLTASQPAAFVATGEGVRQTHLMVPYADGTVFLDVYAPTTPTPPVPGARGGLLIIPGVGDNRGDAQVVNLSNSLARAGEVVMLMTTQTLINFDLASADSDAVVQAFNRLSVWPGVGANRVGIVGISAGDAIVCLAATDPRIRDRVAFIIDFGGFYDALNLLHDFGRRAIEVDGKLQPWQPADVPKAVLSNVLAPVLPAPDGARLQAGFNLMNPNPLTPDDAALLSPEGAAAYHLLAGDAPSAVDANIALLVPLAGELLRQLSPSAVVSQIRAPIYLLHSRTDMYVPFTESRDFNAALTRLHHPHDYVEITIFQHVEVQSGLPLGSAISDGARLARILFEALLVGS
jgi:hypothetical protein